MYTLSIFLSTLEDMEISMNKNTLKDVAEYAGVSIASVSYVINGKGNKLSTETEIRVRQAIEKLKYVPSYTARSLKNNKSMLIGVIIPQTEGVKQLLLDNPFYSELISGIEFKTRECGYHIILSGVDNGRSYMDVSIQRNLDGAIIMGIYNESFYDELKKVNIPIALIDSYVNDNYFYTVGVDDEMGGYLAVKYLIDCGHKNIALVTGTIRQDGVTEKRFLGYKKALKEAQLFYNPDYIYENAVNYNYGYEAGMLIAKQNSNITAIFATADMIALGLIKGLKEFGKTVPDDISVIGFDDINMARIYDPPLTTIRQEIFKKGLKAAELVVDAIEKNIKDEKKEILLPLCLVERKTVKKI